MSPPPLHYRALPTVGDCELKAAGIDWDAIRVPRAIGLQALKILGPRSGAVIEDPFERALYWFVIAGASSGWAIPDTRALGVTQHLTVPPRRRACGPGPHWRICPGQGRWLTDLGALHAALEDAFAPLHAPREEVSR
jgi:hypothetical protein